ncbi:MAG: Crp/Fnr family transcriptional regulator [Pseudomonadota bacterium]|nr:Crp/Fnr family transcriptional regulator [Pseudomonadota bacterium]
MENSPFTSTPFDGMPDEALLSDADLQVLKKHSRIRSYPRNTVILSEGEESDALYIIQSGRVKVYLSDETGKEITLTLLGPGAYLGELAMLDGEPRSASVMTLEKTTMLQISRDAFRGFLAENPDIAFEIIRLLTARIRNTTEQVRNLAFKNVYCRVANVLNNMSSVARDGARAIPERLTQQEIADMVGASREMVSRVLSELTKGEYISVQSKHITINRELPADW